MQGTHGITSAFTGWKTVLNEVGSWVPFFLKVFLEVLLLYFNVKPEPRMRAGSAKKEISRSAKPAESNHPSQVRGLLPP